MNTSEKAKKTKKTKIISLCLLGGVVIAFLILVFYTGSPVSRLKNVVKSAEYDHITEVIGDMKSTETDKVSSSKRFANYTTEIVDEFLEQGDYTSASSILNALEDEFVKNEYIANHYTECNWMDSTAMSLTEKIYLAKENFSQLDYYIIDCGITRDEIDAYIEEHEEPIYTSSGTKGYYDEANRKNNKYRDITEGGWIESEQYQYFGDFMIKNSETEYVDSNYDIKTIENEQLYFRQWYLNDIGTIDTFSYAPPFLFSICEDTIEIFTLEPDADACYSRIKVNLNK